VANNYQYSTELSDGFGKMLKYEVHRRYFSNLLIFNRYGKQHRKDGPAFMEAGGGLVWREYHVRHRKNGPAYTYKNGLEEYWLRGKRQC
jgi:hypothetical protein